MKNLIFVLQNILAVPDGERISLYALYGSRENALKEIEQFSTRTIDNFPMNGLPEAIRDLRIQLGPVNELGVPTSIAR